MMYQSVPATIMQHNKISQSSGDCNISIIFSYTQVFSLASITAPGCELAFRMHIGTRSTPDVFHLPWKSDYLKQVLSDTQQLIT